jgi:hypothetical protein
MLTALLSLVFGNQLLDVSVDVPSVLRMKDRSGPDGQGEPHDELVAAQTFGDALDEGVRSVGVLSATVMLFLLHLTEGRFERLPCQRGRRVQTPTMTLASPITSAITMP